MQENITIPFNAQKFVPPLTAELAPGLNSNASKLIAAGSAQNYESAYFSPLTADRRLLFDFFKRGIDISVSLLLLLMLAPLFILIPLLIKITSPGPVIFVHRRIGRNGKEFGCWKFRTMVCNADEILQQDPELKKQFDEKFKIDHDPRVTGLGELLRQTSLDELPQLFQVVQGKMSLIGPRPVIARELAKYSIYRSKLLSVKPGLSGLWQTSGRSTTTYAERVLLDMQYIDNRGARLDTQLLLRTVITVLKKSGAC